MSKQKHRSSARSMGATSTSSSATHSEYPLMVDTGMEDIESFRYNYKNDCN